MPKFVIERQYLVPMYQHIVVEAETLEEACTKGISDDIDWDSQEMDCDSARATTITNAKVVPEGAVVGQHHDTVITKSQEMTLGSFLYENDTETGCLLSIPDLHRTKGR